MSDLLTAIGIAVPALIAFMIVLTIIRRFLIICKPNEIVVFSGRRRTLADGSTVGFDVLQQGSRVRIPILETASRIDTSTMTVDIHISNAYSRGNIPLVVHAIANVKISRRPGIVENAVERFLGRNREEIRRVAKETIEGALRGVLATLTPEQVNEDRLSFVQALADECEEDLHKIGLQIDTLKIQSVTDEVKYLDSIGRARIAEVLRDAEVSESNYKRESDKAVADAEARARVAREQAQGLIQAKQNDVRRMIAELEAQARSEEEKTVAAATEARARAEIRLQDVRRELERLRLQADQVLPAQAQQTARELLAAGEAAAISAEGRATADALRMISESWKDAGAYAQDILAIQQLEPTLRKIADHVGKATVHNVNLIDGGDGASLGRLAGAYPAMINQVLEEIGQTTGVRFNDIINRTPAIDAAAARPAARPAAAPAAAAPAATAATARPAWTASAPAASRPASAEPADASSAPSSTGAFRRTE